MSPSIRFSSMRPCLMPPCSGNLIKQIRVGRVLRPTFATSPRKTPVNMTLLLCSDGFTSIFCVSISPFSSSSSSSTGSISMAVTAGTISRFALKPTNLPPNSTVGIFVLPSIAASKRGALSFKASSDVTDNGNSQSESDEDVPMHELPLDAKLQNKLEKKLKMKVAKKIRLRRKKLVRKRRLRKKGRWPPSKMKKLSRV